MAATTIAWLSSGLPASVTSPGGYAGTASAHFPASAYYPIADTNACAVTTDNTGYALETVANAGSGGRTTGSLAVYTSLAWNVPAFIGIYLDNHGFAVALGSVRIIRKSDSAIIASVTMSSPPTGVALLFVGTIAASGSAITLALRRLDNGQWLQTDGSWGVGFVNCCTATDASINDNTMALLMQQSGGTLQVGAMRYMPTGTPAISPLTPTVSGGGTQAFDYSGFVGGLVAWSDTLGTITPAGVYTAPAATGSAQTDPVVVTGLGDTTQSATTTVTIPSGTVAATAFTLTGPSGGYNHNPSTDFTFQPNGPYTGTITPAMTGLLGTWQPPSRTWTASSVGQTFVFTPLAVGSGTVNGTASPSLTPPASIPYTSNPQTLGVTPGALPASDVTAEIFYGGGTFWLTSAPTFTPTGVAGVSCGSVSVISNTEAHADVTTGAATGSFTWTDSTTGATAIEVVASVVNVLSIVQGLAPGLSTVGYAIYDEDGSLISTWTTIGVTERGSGNYGAVVAIPAGTFHEIRWSDNDTAPFFPDVVNLTSTSTGGGAVTVAASGLDTVVIESGINIRQAMALALAALAGKATGLATNAPVYKGAGTNTTRISAVTDGNGNRSVVNLTPPA